MKHDDTSLGYETNHIIDAAVAVETGESTPEAEECLVFDDRAGLMPAEHVERKLLVLLRSSRLGDVLPHLPWTIDDLAAFSVWPCSRARVVRVGPGQNLLDGQG
jgi:hypothetical protein